LIDLDSMNTSLGMFFNLYVLIHHNCTKTQTNF